MACDCITKLDEKLRPHNTALAVSFTFGEEVKCYPTLLTRQVETGRGKPKAKHIIPTFCPFCGKSYEEKEGDKPLSPVALKEGLERAQLHGIESKCRDTTEMRRIAQWVDNGCVGPVPEAVSPFISARLREAEEKS